MRRQRNFRSTSMCVLNINVSLQPITCNQLHIHQERTLINQVGTE